ncbi:hypothetical protein SASPL_137860 [Salvia splendens]|uniref:Uncharacterized protein n=1 Tax=Salvia splendens TaxID=180675 RepID=A0A8X8WV81_SALSN|nr:hypothetical protein SASPL_137860 [Salvia splendens]
MSPSSLAAVDRAAIVVLLVTASDHTVFFRTSGSLQLPYRSSVLVVPQAHPKLSSKSSVSLTGLIRCGILKHAPMFLSFCALNYWPLGCTKQLICLWHCSASTLALQFFS